MNINDLTEEIIASAQVAGNACLEEKSEIKPVLEVKNLQTHFFTNAGTVRAVDGVSFKVSPGETVGIVGESGSGKSVTALSIMQLLQQPSRVVGGEILFRGKDILKMAPKELRKLRGADIAMVFQDPMTSLNPVLRIAQQLEETMVVHGFTKEVAAKRAVSILGRMGITAPERAVTNFPHQFSGGMRQRVVMAIGMSNEPALLLADEPTTALDVTIQAQILDLMKELNKDFGTAIVLISHDLGVIAGICERVIVMYAGEVVEEGPTENVLANPRHPYTWALMNAVPRIDSDINNRHLPSIEGMPPDPLAQPNGCRFSPRCPFKKDACNEHPELFEMGQGRTSRCWAAKDGDQFSRPKLHAVVKDPVIEEVKKVEPLIRIEKLVKHFPISGGMFGKPRVVHAVDGIDLSIFPGEVVGVVGESGCGKSSLGRTILRLYKPDSGKIIFKQQDIAEATDAQIRPLRHQMQMIFQDPYASLNPRMTIGQTLGEPLLFHRLTNNKIDTRNKVEELLGMVGMSKNAVDRYPHEFSGGQRQRVAIARAIALSPDFIVADEPISALDVNIQAQIINLMIDLRASLNLTYLFIAHDLAVVRHISDRVVVLHLGKVAEVAPAKELFDNPMHPYTRYLISAIPVPDVAIERNRARVILSGEAASTIAPPTGCRFRTRCPIAKPICTEIEPQPMEHRPGHIVACHFAV
jgi:peptide/nickel transport system ATP-binding protein